jgi:multisubunit Na+/H+ antiporter MnhB subunit
MIVDAFYAAPALLILALGIYTTVARDTFPATVGYLAYGLLLTVAWVQLHGVDVALTEAAIGGGLTAMLLVRASAKLRAIEAQARRSTPSLPVRLLAGLLAAGVAGALATALLTLPDPAPTLAPEALANMASTGVGNPITAVLMAYRAMDTLLEATVLLLALIGVWSLAPDRVWGGRPGPRYNADPDGILAFIARVLPPIGIIVGVYIFWVGADHPGGKFQGATIIAAMWLLTLLAGLSDAPPISRRWLRVVLVAGPAVFIGIGIAGVPLTGTFLAYPEGWAKPMILVIEFALMPSLALTLGLIMAGAPERATEP